MAISRPQHPSKGETGAAEAAVPDAMWHDSCLLSNKTRAASNEFGMALSILQRGKEGGREGDGLAQGPTALKGVPAWLTPVSLGDVRADVPSPASLRTLHIVSQTKPVLTPSVHRGRN